MADLRSAALRKLSQYEDCLRDIARAAKFGYPRYFLKNIYSSSVYNFLFLTIENDPFRQNIYKLWERKGKCYEGLKR